MAQNQQVVVQPQNNSNYLINFDEQQLAIIKAQYFPPTASPLEIDFCLNVAKSLGLNPITNEIYFIERKSKVNNQWLTKVEPLAGRNAYRKIANRSGDLVSIEVETYLKDTPKLVNGEWVEGTDLVAVCTIYKKGHEKPFVVEVEYSEYVQRTKEGVPTKFWKEKPKTMLKKVAESQCLKMAFDISGIYDENEIMDVEVQPQYINPKLTEPPKKAIKRRTPSQKEIKAQNFMATQQATPKHDNLTGEIIEEEEAPTPQKSLCAFAYSVMISRGIVSKDLNSFCDFLNLTTEDEVQMLIDDAELFEAKKNEFYGASQ